jgi:hypothetical protein
VDFGGGSPASAGASAFASPPPRRPSGGADLVRALRELSTSVHLAAAPGAPPPGGVRESDEAFLSAKARAAALEKQLVDASARAERLVGRAAAACDALGDAGLAFVRLSKFEEAEGARRGRFAARGAAQRLAAADARAAGAAAVRACRLGRAAAGQLAAQLAPLHGHLSLAPAVSRAVADRADALLTWQTLAAEADAKRAKAARTQEEPLKARGLQATQAGAHVTCADSSRARGHHSVFLCAGGRSFWSWFHHACVQERSAGGTGQAGTHICTRIHTTSCKSGRMDGRGLIRASFPFRRWSLCPPRPRPRPRSTTPSARETRPSSRDWTRRERQTLRCVRPIIVA